MTVGASFTVRHDGAVPVIAMDEAGHTGENLLDSEQAVYALAGVRLEEGTADAAVSAALGRAQANTKELKFSRLRKSNVGRKNVLTLLNELATAADDAAVIVVHKPWMVAAKLIDELMEPRMLAKGVQAAWYGTGAARSMALAFHERAPRALGETYTELASAFVAMVREYTPERGAAFLQTLGRCKVVCRDNHVHDLLSVMIDTQHALDAEFGSREDALDPALTCLFWQAGYWSSELGTRFEVLHDDSTAVRRWQATIFGDIQGNMANRTAADSFTLGEVTVHLPTLLDAIRFETSHDDARLQVADVLAGAAAHFYAVTAGLRRDDGDFARDLYRAGIVDLIKEAVGPDDTGPS
jgi:hypothetical protein